MGCAVDYFSPRRRGGASGARKPRTPAARIIARLGGAKQTAALAGVLRQTVYRWLAPGDRGGSGGRVPHAAQASLVRATADWDAPLTFEEFAPRDGEEFL